MNHPTRQALLEYSWSVPGDPRFSDVADHVAGCERCRNAHSALRAVEQSLHRMKVESPSPNFTRDLLQRLGLREATPLWWMFLKNFAPVLVAGIVAAVVIALGSSMPVAGEPPAPKSLFDARPVMEAVRLVLDRFTAWTAAASSKYLTFSLGSDGVSLAMFLCFLFAGIGLLDRYLLGPIFRRKNY